MLPKDRRIKKSLFPKIIEEGANFFYPYFSLKISQIDPSLPSKFSFVVSAKVKNSAVARNLLKRRARNIIKERLNKIKLGYALIFFFKKPVNDLKFSQLENEIDKALLKSKMIKNV